MPILLIVVLPIAAIVGAIWGWKSKADGAILLWLVAGVVVLPVLFWALTPDPIPWANLPNHSLATLVLTTLTVFWLLGRAIQAIGKREPEIHITE